MDTEYKALQRTCKSALVCGEKYTRQTEASCVSGVKIVDFPRREGSGPLRSKELKNGNYWGEQENILLKRTNQSREPCTVSSKPAHCSTLPLPSCHPPHPAPAPAPTLQTEHYKLEKMQEVGRPREVLLTLHVSRMLPCSLRLCLSP